MKILAIDTSTSAASCAVISDKKLEAEVFLDYKLHHSILLFPMIEEMLERLEININEIDVVAVGGGPGSFTGLRIGVAAAKGLCLGGDKKFIGVSALDAIAYDTYGFEGVICPMIDALRDSAYTALYRWENEELVKIMDYKAIHISDLVNEVRNYNEMIMFTGDCIKNYKQLLREELGSRAIFSLIGLTMPRAAAIGELAFKRANKSDFDDIRTYSPIYLKKPQAEREYEKKYGVTLD